MKAALISRGPITARMFPGRQCGGYDVVIGVESVIEEYECDWYVTADCDGYRDTCHHPRLGKPRLWLDPGTGRRVLDSGDENARRIWREDEPLVRTFDTLRPLPPMPAEMTRTEEGVPRWAEYSGCAALGLAWTLEATQVNCFGVDLAGESDFQGQTVCWRPDTRWERERRIWFPMAEGFTAAGMDVRMVRCVPARMAAVVDGVLEELQRQ